MEPIGRQGDTIIFKNGIRLASETYAKLLVVVGEDDQNHAPGKSGKSLREIAMRTGIDAELLPSILRGIRRYNKLMAEHRDRVAEEADLAFRPPAADLYPSQRRASGQLFHPLRGELLDRHAARPGRDTPGDRSALVSKPALSPAA